MLIYTVLIWFAVRVVIAGSPQSGLRDWDAADRATKRLLPSAFSSLPFDIRADLERRGCTIPQPYAARRPENVIEGRFTSSRAMDWAVLCSRARVSSILVFRGGSPSAVAEVAATEDRDYLQDIGGGKIGFSRQIGVAGPTVIQKLHKAYGGPKLPPLDHDGINDAFIDKASVIKYWYLNRWLNLQGAD